MIVAGSAGTLHDEDIAAPNVIADLNRELTITKSNDLKTAELNV
jgi:hypothetical protein